MTIAEAIEKLVSQFGMSIITERRFIYMISDYHSFKDNQAHKHVLTAILQNSDIVKLTNAKPDEIDLLIKQITHSISDEYGFKDDIIIFVLNEILTGLNIKPRSIRKRTNPISISAGETRISKYTSHTEIKHYSGSELLEILKGFFIPPNVYDLSDISIKLKEELGQDKWYKLFNYFLNMGVIRQKNSLSGYTTDLQKAYDFLNLHGEAFVHKGPLAIANNILQGKLIPLQELSIERIKYTYDINTESAKKVIILLQEDGHALDVDSPITPLIMVSKLLIKGKSLQFALKSIDLQYQNDTLNKFMASGLIGEDGCLDKDFYNFNYYLSTGDFVKKILYVIMLHNNRTLF